MDALNHADQMRLANLISDNLDDAEIQKKLDQVVELTSLTRDQAAVALHDCHYDVGKAVDMILEGDQAIVENQWKSAGKKKNKNLSSQASEGGPKQLPAGGQQSLSGGSKQPPSGSQQPPSGGQQPPSAGQQPSTGSLQPPSASQQIPSPGHQHHQRPTRIPDSAVEMPNNELHFSSLNVQFGELDLRDDSNTYGSGSTVGNRQSAGGLQNSHHSSSNTTIVPQTNQDGNTSRQQQQHLTKQSGGPRRTYNINTNKNSNNDDRRFYSRGARQISGANQRPYNNQRGSSNPMSTGNNATNSRGVRTILNRGLQPNSNLSRNPVIPGPSTQPSNSRFPNSIDTWTNSTAEAATKKSNPDPAVSSLRVGQWTDVAGTEDWSEEDWEAKVMETKVFTPSTKSVDGTVSNQKIQPLLTDSSMPTQINLASKLSESVRDDASSQQNTLNSVTSQSQAQQSPQKPLSHINDIFDTSIAKAVLEHQNLASIKPKSSMSMGQYSKDSADSKTVLDHQNLNSIKPKSSMSMGQFSKDSADAKTVLDQQNLNSIKPKTTMTMNQYSKEASESLKSLVGISSTTKSNVPSVPPGALPIMSQPQYIMGNAYQPAIFPYAYQTPDVHYQVAAQTSGREQNFQSVYSPNDANKFNRGTEGDTPAINTTQAAPVASQTHNQAFVANALHAGYQLTYAMPGAFNMMPQNLYSAAPIFPHIPQPTNTGSTNTVYQKNNPTSYLHHSGYSAYDQLNPLIQDYVKHQQQNYTTAGMQHQQQQHTGKASASTSELDVISEGNSYNMYGSMNKSQPQVNKQANYNESKGYQQQMSNNGPQQQFGLSHNAQPSSMTNYPLLQAHNLDGTSLNSQTSTQHQLQQLQQHANARNGNQLNPSKYYPSWN